MPNRELRRGRAFRICLLCEKAPECSIENFEEEVRIELSALRKGPKMRNRELRRGGAFCFAKRPQIPNRDLRRGKASSMCLLCEKAKRCPIGNFEEDGCFELSALRIGPKIPTGNLEEEGRFELSALRKGPKMPNRELRRGRAF